MHAQLLQSCLTLYNPMDCSLPGSSVRGILQARLLKLPFPSPGDLPDLGIEPTSYVSLALEGWFFTTSATWEALFYVHLICKICLSSILANDFSWCTSYTYVEPSHSILHVCSFLFHIIYFFIILPIVFSVKSTNSLTLFLYSYNLNIFNNC